MPRAASRGPLAVAAPTHCRGASCPSLQADPLLFSLLVDVAVPCKNGTEEAAIVAGQVVLELTTAAAIGSGAGGEAGGQGNPL